jgi:hypothetical protein
MDVTEWQEAARREKVKALREDQIARYDRNVPIWWGELKKLFADPIWEGNDFLNTYCQKWFGVPEAEMKAFMRGEWRDYQLPRPELTPEPALRPVQASEKKFGESIQVLTYERSEEDLKAIEAKTKAAARAKAYRERKKAGK